MSCDGCFVVLSQQGQQQTFVADRLAWHQANVLGDLGMDAGRFDAVTDRTALRREERETFYEMLASVSRAGTQELLRRTADQTTNVVPLFNRPESMRGELVVLEGRARRAIPIRIEDVALARRLGFDHYWELEIFTEDSQSNPLVVCALQLPEGMPRGERINEPVRVPAFFLKSWSYQASGAGEGRLQLAPLLIGREPEWLASVLPSTNPYVALIAGVCFTLALAALWLVLWRVGRNDERFRRRTLAKKYEMTHDGDLDSSAKLEIAPPSHPVQRDEDASAQ